MPARGIVRGSHVVWPESDVPVLCAKARKMSAEEQRNRRRYGAAAAERSSREGERERGSMKAERNTSTKPFRGSTPFDLARDSLNHCALAMRVRGKTTV